MLSSFQERDGNQQQDRGAATMVSLADRNVSVETPQHSTDRMAFFQYVQAGSFFEILGQRLGRAIRPFPMINSSLLQSHAQRSRTVFRTSILTAALLVMGATSLLVRLGAFDATMTFPFHRKYCRCRQIHQPWSYLR